MSTNLFDRLDDHVTNLVISHLDANDQINLWRATRHESLIQHILSVIQLNHPETMSMVSINMAIDVREKLIKSVQADLNSLLQQRELKRKQLQKDLEKRLIKIPFKNFVALRYWKRHTFMFADFTNGSSAMLTEVDHNVLNQCPCCLNLAESNSGLSHNQMTYEYIQRLQFVKHLPNLYGITQDIEREQIQSPYYPKKLGPYYSYSYGDANHTIEWFSCREYLPIRDQKFVQSYSLTPEELEYRQKTADVQNGTDHWSGYRLESDSFEDYQSKYWIPDKLQPPDFVVVDPNDYPVDRRYLLQNKELDPLVIGRLTHYETPPDYDVGCDLCDLQIIETQTGRICGTEIIPKKFTTPEGLQLYMHRFDDNAIEKQIVVVK